MSLFAPKPQAPITRPAPQARKGTSLAVIAATFTLLLAACGSSSDSAAPAPAPVADLACQQNTGTSTVVVGSGVAGDPSLPEASSGYKLGNRPVVGEKYMVVTANPLASAAGCAILRAGGNAIDAAVAVQAVLGLVEPQSSGLGGGAFMLHYNATTKQLDSYDGRETAPAAATENYLRWVGSTAATGAPLPNARASGRSVGTPGVMRMLEMAHRDHGTVTWANLFNDGIRLANDGFRMSGRMTDAIAANRASLLRDPDATAYFMNADTTPKALGTLMRNPAYAETLRAIATGGANAFYTGPIAQGIIDKIAVTSGGSPSVAITPGVTTMADLAAYQAKKRTPVCINYRNHEVCGMGPPSSGGIAVAQTLGILENFNVGGNGPTIRDANGGKPSILGVHLVAEAQRLAYADRNQYVADTDFVPLPGQGVSSMLSKTYLRQRANLISLTRSMGTATAGTFSPTAAAMGIHAGDGNGTTHVTIIDARGNVVSFTTTVESSMGSFKFTKGGFLLNNQLTDFSAEPSDATGPIANRVAANKRPRSSMAPTIVFRLNPDGSRGDVAMATGSPGGAAIIQFVTKTVIGVVDWSLDAQQATSMMNFGAANSPVTGLGGEHPNLDLTNNSANDSLVVGLRNLGHTVNTAAQSSGVSTIVRGTGGGKQVLVGGADPRREGIALGDGVTP